MRHIKRLLKVPTQSFFLLGPRGTGKTTWIKDHYPALYLKEEIQAEGLVRNVGDFAKFLEVMSFSHGSLLNLNNIASECNVSRSTVSNYLQILFFTGKIVLLLSK
jgi:predicted AAA+ superfamily ATPase